MITSSPAHDREVDRGSEFPLLPIELLGKLTPAVRDQVSEALGVVTRPASIGSAIDLIALHERALKVLGPVTIAAGDKAHCESSRSEREATAYDKYFSVIRAEGDERRIFALGILTAFRDLFTDMKHGTELDEVGLSAVRLAEYELLRLIANDKDLYY